MKKPSTEKNKKFYHIEKIYELVDVFFTDNEKKELTNCIKNKDKKGTTMFLLPIISYLEQKGYFFIKGENELI